MFDVDNFVAIILPPQAAMMAVGSVKPRPVVKDNEIVIEETMNVTLSSDHRVVDGAEGAKFVGELKKGSRVTSVTHSLINLIIFIG